MTFSQSINTVFRQKYATFSGRASRSEYWWVMLAYFLVFIPVGAVGGVLFAVAENGGNWMPFIAVAAVGGLLFVATLLPALAVQVRRFHDRNVSGWWYLALQLVGFIPYVGWFASIAMLVISLFKGTNGENRFGPDPLQPEMRAEVFA